MEEDRIDRGLTDAEKEQIKLPAAYLNGIAIGSMLVGGISVPTSIVLSIGGGRAVAVATVTSLVCFAASTYIHRAAKRKLRELDR